MKALFLGFDFGSTTSSFLAVNTSVFKNSITGRLECRETVPIFRSNPIFTPYKETDPERIDEEKLEALIKEWLGAIHSTGVSPTGGGAILTGLAAQSKNAARITQKIKMVCADAIIATARDPHFESWLAWQGGACPLSKQYPDHIVINLDVGGGTTNLAVGIRGEVKNTGSIFVGARHIQFIPGTYCINHITPYGKLAFESLHLSKKVGETLTYNEGAHLTQFYVETLKALSVGDQNFFIDRGLTKLIDAPWRPFDFQKEHPIIVTFTGGVGELVYAYSISETWPNTTFFGDLGIDLAKAIAQSPFMDFVKTHQPVQKGRATLTGITLCSTELSGSTLFISDKLSLPLDNVPVLAHLSGLESEEKLKEFFRQIRQVQACSPVCICFSMQPPAYHQIKALGEQLSRVLSEWENGFYPLVLLVPQNFGHVLGCYITRWKRRAIKLLVIDEISIKNAKFVRIGAPFQQVIPVTFYGFFGD